MKLKKSWGTSSTIFKGYLKTYRPCLSLHQQSSPTIKIVNWGIVTKYTFDITESLKLLLISIIDLECFLCLIFQPELFYPQRKRSRREWNRR